MPTDDIIIRLFLIVDERLGNCKKRSDAHLYVSEIVTIGLLFALKGKRFSAFYRWLWANYRHWFPNLPEYSRLSRLVSDYSELADEFLAEPSFFTILDPFGIELIHPRREGPSKKQIGKKGISNGRWIVGVKLAWLVNDHGEVVDWAWGTADAPDNVFRDLALRYNGRTITLTDQSLRERGAKPSNLKHCERGRWNERFVIETNYSWLTEFFDAKKLYHRVTKHLVAHLHYLAALMNCLLRYCRRKAFASRFCDLATSNNGYVRTVKPGFWMIIRTIQQEMRCPYVRTGRPNRLILILCLLAAIQAALR